jgi:hypothetical protein
METETEDENPGFVIEQDQSQNECPFFIAPSVFVSRLFMFFKYIIYNMYSQRECDDPQHRKLKR